MAVVILETILQGTNDNLVRLIADQDKIVDIMLVNSYSYKIIGLVLILLNEGKQTLPIDTK